MPVTIIPAPPSTAATENTATKKTTIANPPKTSNASNPIACQAENVPADSAKVCWLEVKRYPYQPDHQVELLNLQAEADALIIKLQATDQKRLSEIAAHQ